MRMHATIAALSSGVPAAIVAYSVKARGVFASVGQQRHVADARRLDDDALLDALWRSCHRAQAGRRRAGGAGPGGDRAGRGEQMDEIVAVARAERDRRTAVGAR